MMEQRPTVVYHPEYGVTRALEAYLACQMVAIGMVLLWPGDTLLLPHYGLLRLYFNEQFGGLVLLIVGTVRACALWVNGRKSPTPFPRLLGCAVGAGFWFALFLAVEEGTRREIITVPPLILAVSFTSFTFEFYSALRAGSDASYLQSFKGSSRIGLWLRPK